MISLLLLAATPPAIVQLEPITVEVEAEFRRRATETCPRILSDGRAFFSNETKLSASGLTISPMFKSMLSVPASPISVKGAHVTLIYQDSGTTRNTKVMCMINGRPGVDIMALRDRFFASLAPAPQMIKQLKQNDFVGFAYPQVGDVIAYDIVFWRDGIFVKPSEKGIAR